MNLARVVGNIVSTDCYEAYRSRKLMLVQKLDLHGKPEGQSTMAIDYVGCGEGDIVLLGAAPGLASSVLAMPDVPVRELIMGIVDRVSFLDGSEEFGISVKPKDA